MTIEQTIEELKNKIDSKKKDKTDAETGIESQKTLLNKITSDLYELELRYLHIKRIFELASLHFPRLRGEQHNILTKEDHKELDKWIFRAQSIGGLQDIVNALAELSKYFPKDIKSNLYGLVQRIIIEGAYRVKKEKEKDGKN